MSTCAITASMPWLNKAWGSFAIIGDGAMLIGVPSLLTAYVLFTGQPPLKQANRKPTAPCSLASEGMSSAQN